MFEPVGPPPVTVLTGTYVLSQALFFLPVHVLLIDFHYLLVSPQLFFSLFTIIPLLVHQFIQYIRESLFIHHLTVTSGIAPSYFSHARPHFPFRSCIIYSHSCSCAKYKLNSHTMKYRTMTLEFVSIEVGIYENLFTSINSMFLCGKKSIYSPTKFLWIFE
jgi:hypothetical protein